MDRQKLLELTQNPNFIPGIYNYCDRWCERCAFTRRCLNFAMQEEELGKGSSEQSFQSMVGHVLESFRITRELLDDTAREHGVNPDELVDQELIDESKAREEPISQNARAYSTMVKQWFESNVRLFEEQAEKVRNNLVLGMGDQEIITADIFDAIEVIQWHHHQIWVKLIRALHGKEDEESEVEGMDEFQKDSDGSAKVALIGIDRSVRAWSTLGKHLGNQTSIAGIRNHLGRLRDSVEVHFPRARLFVRPGFDQEG